jgi:hypothetical protein
MISGVQTFGDLINFHPHIHALVPCGVFLKSGCFVDLKAGIKRNFEVFDSCDFLAEVTQHIPDRGEHQVRYYGWYSNKMRGQRAKREACEKPHNEEIVPKNAPTWAMLIKCIFEVDPLKCPDCGEKMRIVSFILIPVQYNSI